jgi:hypothetical protein
MNIPRAILLTTLVISTALYVESQVPTSKQWNPATYHGLVVGKSTRAEVFKVLGKPKWVGREQDTGVPIMSYDVTNPLTGELEVYISKGILDSMSLNLKENVSQKDIIRLFGHNYIVVHYAMDDCLDDGGAAPIYRNPNGPIKTMQYRDRGLVAYFVYNDDETVDAIIFTNKQYGRNHSLCAVRSKKK